MKHMDRLTSKSHKMKCATSHMKMSHVRNVMAKWTSCDNCKVISCKRSSCGLLLIIKIVINSAALGSSDIKCVSLHNNKFLKLMTDVLIANRLFQNSRSSYKLKTTY